jgi:uncharacterized membrane protein
MVEISWEKAFGYGIRFILFIILWAIIGGLIAVAGGLMIASSVNITFNRIPHNSIPQAPT